MLPRTGAMREGVSHMADASKNTSNPNQRRKTNPKPKPQTSRASVHLTRRMPLILRRGHRRRPRHMPALLSHMRRSRLRTVLSVPRRRPVVTLRPVRIARVCRVPAMRRRTMLVATRRHHRVNGRTTAPVRHLSTQMLASAEHFSAAVATRIKVTMALSVRTNHPKVRAAADEHHVAIHHARDIDIAWR